LIRAAAVRELDDRQRHLYRRHRDGAAKTIVEGKLAIPPTSPSCPTAARTPCTWPTSSAIALSMRHRFGRRRAARAWRHARLSDRHFDRPQARAAVELVLDDGREGDRKTGKLVATLNDFAAPVDALEMADGTLYVAELAAGTW
jgi:hypothetical protein